VTDRRKNTPKSTAPKQDAGASILTVFPAGPDAAPPAPAEPPAKAVLRWLTEGHDEQTIREALRGLHPEAGADAVIAEAIAELREDGKIDPDLIRGWALRSYRDLYRRMLEIGDFDGCRKAMKEIVALAR
jgi:hypothetical protein